MLEPQSSHTLETLYTRFSPEVLTDGVTYVSVYTWTVPVG
jgi:hypothetical protein